MAKMRYLKLAALLWVLVLGAVACGGETGGDTAATGPDTAAEETTAAGETTADGETTAAEETTAADGGTPNAGGEDRLIGVSLASPTIPLYVAMAEGIRDQAAEVGVEVVFTDADEDVEAQLNDVQDLISQGVDGILISPIDSVAAVPAYEDARAQDITIVSIARNVEPEYEDAFVGARWETYGRQIAEWTCEEAGGEGTIAMIKGPAGASFVEEMEVGYKDFMASDCPGMTIVFETNAAPLSAEQGLTAAQDALSANPDVTAIYANNDELAEGAIRALEEQDRVEEVIVTGFDGNETGLANIRDGAQDMTIALRPYAWGQLGLDTILQVLDGEDVGEVVEIETILLAQSNIGDHDDEELR